MLLNGGTMAVMEEWHGGFFAKHRVHIKIKGIFS